MYQKESLYLDTKMYPKECFVTVFGLIGNYTNIPLYFRLQNVSFESFEGFLSVHWEKNATLPSSAFHNYREELYEPKWQSCWA